MDWLRIIVGLSINVRLNIEYILHATEKNSEAIGV